MARPRKKKENRGLPKGWRYKHGAYRYSVPVKVRHLWDGKTEFTLGKTLPEAYMVWAERLNNASEIATVSDLMDRYLLEHVPTKSFSAQESDRLAIRRLRPVFGHMLPREIQPVQVYKYADLITKNNGFTSAKHDIQTLRHIMTKAVQWGVINNNQLLGQVRLETPVGVGIRDRLVEDWEVAEVLSVKSRYRGVKIANHYIRFKLMTGLRRIDILRLRLNDLKEDGIHVQPSKTKQTTRKRLIIEWDEYGELRTLVNEILRIPPSRIGSATLFTTRQGKCYVDARGKSNAFDSLWQRFMGKTLADTNVSDRFQERDLRAKVASDSDTLVEASERLGHAYTEITQRVYRRKPVRVKPLFE